MYGDGDGVGAGRVVDGADISAGVAGGGRTNLQLEGRHQQSDVLTGGWSADAAVLAVPGHQQRRLADRGRTAAATRPGHHHRVIDRLPPGARQGHVGAGGDGVGVVRG